MAVTAGVFRSRQIFGGSRPSWRAVTNPYRSETDALLERKTSLEQEIARVRQLAHELETLRSREQELERELAAVAQKLGAGAKRALPLLDQVRVASPCNASWDEMLGDDRVRFCMSCEKNVYNLSAMPREDAERLLQERAGDELCVRFYQRADGTILTEDCPIGMKKKRRKKLALAVAGAGAMAFAATSMLARSVCVTQGTAMPVSVNTIEEPAPPEPAPIPVPTGTGGEMGDRAPRVTMGAAVAVPPPTTATPTTKAGPPGIVGQRVRGAGQGR
jgi:hypothetical protein